MIGDFERVFQNEKIYEMGIPASLQKAIDKDLPNGLTYKRIDGDYFVVSSKQGTDKMTVNLRLPDKISELIKEGEMIKSNDVAEYMYNSQKGIEIESGENKFLINDRPINMDEYIKNPFDNVIVSGSKMLLFPEKMTEEFSFELEGENIKKVVQFKRIPNDDVFIKKYISENTCLIISVDVDRRNIANMKFNINVDVFKAEGIEDVISTYGVLKAIAENNISVNGIRFTLSDTSLLEIPPANILDFWNKAKEVEQVLGKKFDLKNGVRELDAKNVYALYRTLIEKKPYREDSDTLYLKGERPDEKFLERIKNVKGFYLEYYEKTSVKIFGNEIVLYALVGIFNARLVEEDSRVEEDFYRIKLASMKDRQMYRSFMYYLEQVEKEDYEEHSLRAHTGLLENAEKLETIDFI